MSVTFEVSFRPYHSNVAYNLKENLTKAEARKYVSDLIKYNRKLGYPVSVIERGTMYEIEQPENGYLIHDDQGILEIDSYEIYDENEIEFWEEYELLTS